MTTIVSWLRSCCTCLLLIFAMVCPIQAQLNTSHILQMGRMALSVDDYLTAIRHFSTVIDAKPQQADAYFYRAHAKFSLDDYHGSEQDCDVAIQLNPYKIEYNELRGLCRIRRQAYGEAIADYRRVLQENPFHQTSLYNKALCHLSLHQYAAADSTLNVILHRWHTFRNAYLVKAQLHLEQKDTLAGLFWMDSLLQLTETEPSPWIFKGLHALSQQHYAAADSFLSRAIALQPRHFELYLSRAQARHTLFRFDAAIADYGKVISLVPKHYVAHYNRALLRALVGDYNAAVKDFDFVLSLDSKNTLARYNRALLRERIGHFQGAVDDYTLLLREYPSFYAGYAARARCRRRTGDWRGAANDESVVARAELDLIFAPHKRRPIKKLRKQSELALQDYQLLIEADEDTAQLITTLKDALYGKVQHKMVDRKPLPLFTLYLQSTTAAAYYSLAVQEYNRYLSTEEKLAIGLAEKPYEPLPSRVETSGEKHPIAHFKSPLLRSISRRKRYDWGGALAEVEKTLQEDSTHQLALFQKALLLNDLSQLHEKERKKAPIKRESSEALLTAFPTAIMIYTELLHHYPKDIYALYNRASLYAQQGNSRAALLDLQHAIAADPRFAEAYFNRGLLYWDMGQLREAVKDLSMAGELGIFQAYNLLKQLRKQEK